MFRSIRWTFLGWHTLILVTVLAGFGAALFHLVRSAKMSEIDIELEARAHVLAAFARGGRKRPPPHWRQFGRRERREELLAEFDADGDGVLSTDERALAHAARVERLSDAPKDRDDRENSAGEPSVETSSPKPMPFEGLKRKMRLPRDLERQYGDTEVGSPYFVVWHPDGGILRESNPPADLEPPEAPAGSSSPSFRQRGDRREIVLEGPRGILVQIGRSIGKELRELNRLASLLVATGCGVLILGLAGGWFVSRRAIRPIEAISSAAAAVSVSNLSQRIDIEAKESELGELSNVLNTTFARLQTAFEQQTRFMADASHELRTPVSVVLTQTEMALRKERTAGEYREVIEACLRSSRRMKNLVDGLLTLVRTDAGVLSLQKARCRLDVLVKDCAALLEPLGKERKITVHLDLQPLELIADSDRMTQVVTNLLTNAIHYNREGGKVDVSLAAKDQEALLRVTDTGMGIAETDRASIFDRFYRVDKARSRTLGGSGLGLAIARNIVEAHGGTIACESEVDVGTTFTVSLPAFFESS